MQNKIQNFLFRSVDISALAFFRIAFGLVMCWEVTRYFNSNWINSYYIQPNFYFTYEGFAWLSPWEGEGMYVHFFVLGVLAIFIALGFLYRLSIVLFFFGFTYVFLLDKSNYLNHFYLISLLSFLMIWIPANRQYAVDAFLFPRIRSQQISAWGLWLLRFQIGIAYFYGGIAKINGDWLQGEPMRMWLSKRTDYAVIGPLIDNSAAAWVFSYGGLAFDLLIVPALLWKRTRIPAFIIAVLFHCTNAYLFKIGIFPWFMIAATTIFFAPDWCRWFFDRIKPLRTTASIESQRNKWLSISLVVFVVWQLLFPFRHLLYPGNVNWTEEGHRFSWHMKLRNKSGAARFYVKNLDTGEEKRISQKRYLSSRQRKKMRTHPDMLLHFAHYLKEVYAQKGQENVSIRAEVKCSLNGRKRQFLIDSNRNLAAIESYRAPADWILPLEEPLGRK